MLRSYNAQYSRQHTTPKARTHGPRAPWGALIFLAIGCSPVASGTTQDGGSTVADLSVPVSASRCSGAATMQADLVYAPTHARNVLDLYLPEQGASCPLLVWIHGGGWTSGDKSLAANSLALRQAGRGYAVASLNYRLSSDAVFPAQLNDVKAALRWLRANAARFRIDPQRIAVAGSSAGGHLAALSGTTGGIAELEDLGQGAATESSRVRAVVDCFGPASLLEMQAQQQANGCMGGIQHDAPGSPESLLIGCSAGLQACPDAARKASPVSYVSADDPPFLLGHGRRDCTVAFQQSQSLAQALTAAGASARLVLNDLGGHTETSCPPAADIDSFLDDSLR